jgi:isopenicillin N synthase-like dioxygenase
LFLIGSEDCPVKSVVNRVAIQLSKALKEKGMAMLVNHGISQEKLKVAYNYFDEFCKLSDDTKALYLRKNETGNHGYVRVSKEKIILKIIIYATTSAGTGEV